MDKNSSTMFTFSILRLWLGPNHKQVDQLHAQERDIVQFWLEPILLFMEDSGSTTKIWKRQEENIKVLLSKNAI